MFLVVTFSINRNIKFLEGFKRKSQIETGNNNTKNPENLDYLIDPTFRNMNRFFGISFKNGNNDPTRDSFDKH